MQAFIVPSRLPGPMCSLYGCNKCPHCTFMSVTPGLVCKVSVTCLVCVWGSSGQADGNEWTLCRGGGVVVAGLLCWTYMPFIYTGWVNILDQSDGALAQAECRDGLLEMFWRTWNTWSLHLGELRGLDNPALLTSLHIYLNKQSF